MILKSGDLGLLRCRVAGLGLESRATIAIKKHLIGVAVAHYLLSTIELIAPVLDLLLVRAHTNNITSLSLYEFEPSIEIASRLHPSVTR